MKLIGLVIIFIFVVIYLNIRLENGKLWKGISHDILIDVKHGCCPKKAIENYNHLTSIDILPIWMKEANEMLKEKIMKRWVEVVVNDKNILSV